MQNAASKSVVSTILDVIRHLLILGATGYAAVWIWSWSSIAAVLAVVPVYVIALNVIGFLTLPLYMFTPEVRRSREEKKALLRKRPD